jgi:hypothetical protein
MIEVLTGILVLITAFYAFVTFRIQRANEGVLEEMRKQNEEVRRPNIVISAVTMTDSPMLYLTVKNSGLSAARDLSLTMDRDFYQFGKKQDDMNLRRKGALGNSIVAFAPQAELLFHLAQGFVVFDKNADPSITPSIFKIAAEYKYRDRTFCEETTIDLNAYLYCSVANDPIVAQLKRIEDAIRKKG